MERKINEAFNVKGSMYACLKAKAGELPCSNCCFGFFEGTKFVACEKDGPDESRFGRCTSGETKRIHRKQSSREKLSSARKPQNGCSCTPLRTIWHSESSTPSEKSRVREMRTHGELMNNSSRWLNTSTRYQKCC